MEVELHYHSLWRQAVEASTAANPPQEQHGVQFSRVWVTKCPLGPPSKQRFDDRLEFLARRRQLVLSSSTFTFNTSLNDTHPLQLLESLHEQ
jgi:hypothetical protein